LSRRRTGLVNVKTGLFEKFAHQGVFGSFAEVDAAAR
jgi:hypothetical protein